MIIAGGTYAEVCRFPHWDRIFGSGLRAALAVSTISPGTILHSYVHDEWRDDVTATLAAFGIMPNLVPAADGITFQYLHPFEKLGWTPDRIHQEPLLKVQGDTVLRFGMLEGEACVAGERVIYDPQSDRPGSFSANGSAAKELALVLNRSELLQCGLPDRWANSQDLKDFNESDDQAAVQNIRDTEHNRNALLVVKRPLGGATVYVGDDSPVVVPAYAANGFFRIGSGDIFSAAFGYAWGELRMAPAAAAHYASRCLGYFVEDHRLPLPAPADIEQRLPVPDRFGHIALSGSKGTLAREELLLHTAAWLDHLGATSILNLFEDQRAALVGNVVLGLVDPQTALQDVSELRNLSAGRPLVLYWPNATGSLASVVRRTAIVSDDYASALYLALRKSGNETA